MIGTELVVESWPADRPLEYPRNARKITQAAVDKVAKSLQAFGFRQPIVVDREDVIIVGHVRLRAAKKLGMTHVPVHVAANLTPAQVRAYRLMDNRSHEEVEWDIEMLGAELLEMRDLEIDLVLTGFNGRELDSLLRDSTGEEKADNAPPLPEVAVTQPGDLWLLGPHRVLCGDSTNAEDTARLLGEDKPILMVSDPPYGVAYDPEWRKRAGVNNSDRMGKVSNDDRADWREAWALFPGDVAYVWHGALHAATVAVSLEACDFQIRSQVIWAKPSLVIGRGHYHWQHEPCWYAVRRTGHWNGDRKQTTLWQIENRNQDAKTIHSTQKPVECMRRPILNHTRNGEFVYDPFLGSGTTLVAAELTGRVCLGLELDAKYVDVVVLRWQELTGQQATLSGHGATFEHVKEGRRLGAEDAIKEDCLRLLAERAE
jgi:DNA modification methylase